MQIFENVQRLKWQEWTYSLECSILEIYNDRIRDLLKPGKEISDQAAIKHDDGERSPEDDGERSPEDDGERSTEDEVCLLQGIAANRLELPDK